MKKISLILTTCFGKLFINNFEKLLELRIEIIATQTRRWPNDVADFYCTVYERIAKKNIKKKTENESRNHFEHNRLNHKLRINLWPTQSPAPQSSDKLVKATRHKAFVEPINPHGRWRWRLSLSLLATVPPPPGRGLIRALTY